MTGISEEARQIHRTVYSTLVSNYVLRGLPIAEACQRAGDESARAAIFFEKKFPGVQTIDTTAREIGAPSAPLKPLEGTNGVKLHPGIGAMVVNESAQEVKE